LKLLALGLHTLELVLCHLGALFPPHLCKRADIGLTSKLGFVLGAEGGPAMILAPGYILVKYLSSVVKLALDFPRAFQRETDGRKVVFEALRGEGLGATPLLGKVNHAPLHL
jgi:hypothetical protein